MTLKGPVCQATTNKPPPDNTSTLPAPFYLYRLSFSYSHTHPCDILHSCRSTLCLGDFFRTFLVSLFLTCSFYNCKILFHPSKEFGALPCFPNLVEPFLMPHGDRGKSAERSWVKAKYMNRTACWRKASVIGSLVGWLA